MRNVDVDHILRTLGSFGRYQWKQIASYLLTQISWAFQGLTIVFIGHLPDFHCKSSPYNTLISNISGIQKEYRKCEIVSYTNTSEGILETSTSCVHGWDYGSPADRSFVTEWDIVCQNEGLGELTHVLYLAGFMAGTFVFPTLSDRFSIKLIMVFSHVIFFGIALGTAFSENYVVFVVLRFLTGFLNQGMLAGTSLSLETLPAEIRHYCEVIALMSWTTCMCLMAPIAYALRNFPWKYLQMTYALFSAWSLLQWWMTDESLRWVIANGQIERAKQIIKNACRWNNKNYKEVMEKIGWGDLVDTDSKALAKKEHLDSKNAQNILEEKEVFIPLNSRPYYQTVGQKNGNIGNDGTDFDYSNQQKANNFTDSNDIQKGGDSDADKDEMKVKRYTVFDIFKNKRILIVSMIMWYTWMCDSLVYFGLYMTSSDLYGDRYINFFLSALVEYPACLLEYLCLARIGRKWTTVIGHLIAAVGLAVATGLTYNAGSNSSMLAAATAFVLIGKLGITTAYSAVYLTTPEHYPTNMRNVGFGVCSFMETIGSMIAPFSRNVSSKIQWLPPCIYAVLCLTKVLLFAFVPETNGVELPQTIEELTEWYRVNKFELKIGKNRYATKERQDSVTKKNEVL